MKTKKLYCQPEAKVIDLRTDDVMKDFVPFSETEVIEGPTVDTDPDNGVNPSDALIKGYSIWDE